MSDVRSFEELRRDKSQPSVDGLANDWLFGSADSLLKEKQQLIADDAKNRASGILPADFQITGLTDCKDQSPKFKLHELPAVQALKPMPPLSEELKQSASPVKINIQVTNVPEVSAGLSGRDFAAYGQTLLQTGVATIRPIAEHLAQPNAVNQDLIATTNLLSDLPDYIARHPDQLVKDGKHAIYCAAKDVEALLERVDKPMTPKERAIFVGANLPYFFMKLKLFDPAVAEEMGLANMSEQELAERGILRFEMPQLQIENDGYSVKGYVPGDRRAWVRVKAPSEGVVEVTSLYNGALPNGTGSKMLAQALKAHGKMPAQTLILRNIINPPTCNQFAAGVAPEKTLMGKCAAKALKELGLVPTHFRFEKIGEALNLIIDLE